MNADPSAAVRRRCSIGRRTLLAAGALWGLRAEAQTFPSKPMTWVLPYAAGGPGDVIARLMAPALRKALGQPIVIENVVGASGSIAVQKLLALPADGHTFMLGTPGDVVLAPLSMAAVKYKPEQLLMVATVARAPLVLLGGTQLPGSGLADLIAELRKPGTRPYSFGSNGAASLFRLVGEEFAARAKLRMTHVPYKGTAPLTTDLIGGVVDMAFLPYAGQLPGLVAQGKLRVYAVADAQRHPLLPDVPTFEQAIGWKSFEYDSWSGLIVPRNTPPGITQRLHAALMEVLQDAAVRSGIEATGATSGTTMTLAEADTFLTGQIATFRRIFQGLKIEPE